MTNGWVRVGDRLERFFSAYGAFFLLSGRWPSALLLVATLVDLKTGLGGLTGLLGVAAARAVGVPGRPDELDRINGLLLGLLIGATFSSWPLLLLSGPAAALATAMLTPEVETRAGLPLLALPFAVAGCGAWWVASSLAVPAAVPRPAEFFSSIPSAANLYLKAMGGIYLSPYPLSGLFVTAAILWRSRYLALLTILGFACSEGCWHILGAVRGGTTSVVGGTGAIVATVLVAGLLTAPGLGSLGLGLLAAALACLGYLALVGPLHTLGTPPLAFPFILATWILLRGFRDPSGLRWLLHPRLPEESAEVVSLSLARGVDGVSVPLAAPFEGEWTVYQASDGPYTHQGAHRYAVDFVKVLCDRSYRGEGTRLSDYYAYDQPVLSPASGVVVATCQSLPDQPPGAADVESCYGNHLIIDLGDGLCVVLAHLRQDSLQVALGDRVAVGQRVAACGSSGRSPQPHLHMHLQRGQGLGLPTLPFHLAGVTEDGCFHLRRDARAGDRLENAYPDRGLVEALKLPVGKRLMFCCEEQGKDSRIVTLTVGLDPAGRFWLGDESGAELSFHHSPAALVLYGRSGPPEPLLDALALAMGVTPLVQGPCRWTDRPPVRLLTGRAGTLWRPLAQSQYNRRRNSADEWLQFGEHAMGASGPTLLVTRAVLHQDLGVREVIVWKDPSSTVGGLFWAQRKIDIRIKPGIALGEVGKIVQNR